MDVLVPEEERQEIQDKLASLELQAAPSGLKRSFSIPGRATKDAAPGSFADSIGRHQDSDTSAEPSHLDDARSRFGHEATILAHHVCLMDGKIDGAGIVEAMAHHTYGPDGGLRNCVFVGHTNTDMDSIGSAIGGADLYGGIATRSEDNVNGEIAFACQYSGLELPPHFREIEGAVAQKGDDGKFLPAKGVVLVDHNEPTQSVREFGVNDTPEGQFNSNRIRGVIDHHAIAAAFKTTGPLFMDIRPWGSACSIITHNYVRKNQPIPERIAKILLCGILSDTLNLTSVTTTDADRLMCILLTILADVDKEVVVDGNVIRGPNALAARMFKAKTNWFVGLGAYAVCRGDKKQFNHGDKGNGEPWKIAWATVEVTEMEPFMKIADELLLELRLMKKEDKENTKNEEQDPSRHLDFAFLTVVDIVNARTNLLICGGRELKLAQIMFPECVCQSAMPQVDKIEDVNWKSNWAESFPSKYLPLNMTCMPLGNDENGAARVSRKKQFIPPMLKALDNGFCLDEEEAKAAEQEAAPSVQSVHVCNAEGCRVHRHYGGGSWFATENQFIPPKKVLCEPCPPEAPR